MDFLPWARGIPWNTPWASMEAYEILHGVHRYHRLPWITMEISTDHLAPRLYSAAISMETGKNSMAIFSIPGNPLYSRLHVDIITGKTERRRCNFRGV